MSPFSPDSLFFSSHLLQTSWKTGLCLLPSHLYLSPPLNWHTFWRKVTKCLQSVQPHRRWPTRLLCPWDSPAWILEWVAISFSRACMHAKLLQSCPTLWPQGQQPTRLLCPQDSLGKNTGVGCHFLLQGSKQPGVKTPLWVLSTILCKTKNSCPKKKWTLRLITPSSQPVPASGRSSEFLAPAI